jgi:hypothetical protein
VKRVGKGVEKKNKRKIRRAVKEVKLSGAVSEATIAKTTEALYQDWSSRQSLWHVNNAVEDLIVRGRCEVKELFDCDLFSASMTPPISFKLEDLAVALR